jgi:DNA-binding SARP family transcriptional activator
MPVRISLLAERSITDAATGAVRTRSVRTLALVAYLVMRAGTAQPRQQLAAMFWPDSSDAQALTNLRRELHALRQIPGAEQCLVVTPADLCRQDTDGVSVDLRRFDRERAAAFAASAGGDLRAALDHADAAWSSTAASCCRGFTTTGCWTPGPRCSVNAWTSARC